MNEFVSSVFLCQSLPHFDPICELLTCRWWTLPGLRFHSAFELMRMKKKICRPICCVYVYLCTCVCVCMPDMIQRCVQWQQCWNEMWEVSMMEGGSWKPDRLCAHIVVDMLFLSAFYALCLSLGMCATIGP